MDNNEPRRYHLQDLLEGILDSDRVYFEPGTNITLTPPYIEYEQQEDKTLRADDKVYCYKETYYVTYVTTEPDITSLKTKMYDTFDAVDYNGRQLISNMYHHRFRIQF